MNTTPHHATPTLFKPAAKAFRSTDVPGQCAQTLAISASSNHEAQGSDTAQSRWRHTPFRGRPASPRRMPATPRTY